MTDTPGGRSGRARHWLVDAAIGASLALGLITVADAALPRLERSQPDRPRLAHALPAAPAIAAAPALPPALVAFQQPEPGYPVISPFGLRQLPWEESGRLHAGVDIAAPAGVPVLAAADGVVTRMATDPGYGRFVEIKHAAGLTSRYGHLAEYLPQIRPGVAVKAGQPIGQTGSTGTSTGSHLHFEIRDRKGRPLNPELFLGRRFATEADLPLKAAQRIPRGVRTAYVSNIPRAKREAMAAKIELAAAADAASADSADVAANASDAATNASEAGLKAVVWGGRPHGRFRASR
ncbi:MAG: peptidase family [Phenylobacterium sp.]|nr:peptidase family [Phenylobacterium sp.]